MNSFIDEFRSCWEQQNIPGTLFIINQIRNDDKINYICFVEGTTDINFYKNINNVPFSNKEIYYIHMLYSKKSGPDISNNLIGKKGIITNYFIIKDNKILNKTLNKCIFVVDHDYDGLVDSKLDNNDYYNFTITQPYAFENYFLNEDNLKEIFKLFNISEKFDNFFELFNKFLKEIYEYNRLISSITATYNDGSNYYDEKHPNYKKSDNFEKFFEHFNFLDNNYYDKKLLDDEIIKMSNAVRNHLKANRYYNERSVNYTEYNNYKGHIIYQFLEDYLNQICNINLKEDSNYEKVVKILSVDIDIKNGNGEYVL